MKSITELEKAIFELENTREGIDLQLEFLKELLDLVRQDQEVEDESVSTT